MKNEIKNFSQFEQLKENSDGFLVSGFSSALSTSSISGGDGVTIPPVGGLNVSCPTNNCQSGNCISGCGTKS
jgi:hypothetical protein